MKYALHMLLDQCKDQDQLQRLRLFLREADADQLGQLLPLILLQSPVVPLAGQLQLPAAAVYWQMETK